MKREIEAVIFDLDGVIVDSMPAHARSWVKCMADHNIECKEQDIFLREGYSSRRIIRELADRKVDSKEIKEITDLRYEYLKEEDMELFKGVPELLRELRGKVKIGIVTGSSREEVEHILPEELIELISIIVTEDDYEEGKPDPEPFLQAVEKLEIEKEKILVVENAPAGVESAKRAGLTVIGLPTYVKKEDLAAADKVVEDQEELRNYLLD